MARPSPTERPPVDPSALKAQLAPTKDALAGRPLAGSKLPERVTLDFLLRHSRIVRLSTLPESRLLLRPLLPSDRKKVATGLAAMSERSRLLRFLTPLRKLSDTQMDYLTNVDFVNHVAIGAGLMDKPGHPGVGVARFVRSKEDPTAAEVAITVRDEYQGKHIGSELLCILADVALAHGVRVFLAVVHDENGPVRYAMKKLGAQKRMRNGTMYFELPLPLPIPHPDARPHHALDAHHHASDSLDAQPAGARHPAGLLHATDAAAAAAAAAVEAAAGVPEHRRQCSCDVSYCTSAEEQAELEESLDRVLRRCRAWLDGSTLSDTEDDLEPHRHTRCASFNMLTHDDPLDAGAAAAAVAEVDEEEDTDRVVRSTARSDEECSDEVHRG